MIMPDKIITPRKSLLVISSCIISYLKNEELTIDSIKRKLNEKWDHTISIEKTMLAIDFLYIIGLVELNNETDKIRMR